MLFTHKLYMEVKDFQSKLKLFAKQLNEQNFVHFPMLKTRAIIRQVQFPVDGFKRGIYQKVC